MSKNIVEVMELLYQVVTFSSLFHLYFSIFSNMIIVLSPVCHVGTANEVEDLVG